MPYASFTASAKCLDRQRLGKQRVEAKQIILALEKGGAWANHPASRMWRGYVPALALYGTAICLEWKNRGYRDTLLPFFEERATTLMVPDWLGNEAFHRSHRSHLLRKAPEWYGRFGWAVPDHLPYMWPVA